ncbi:type II CAAX endopeptidase family protein [Alkaliphilus hydrothermalis]|uniref:Membrane protease YdiL (CAAX protease family) n=1 Tax=Alkaliphilus hydrothermalis TaxID=1482730 RepID=A0ABS2NT19_9FIRM|nr:type II CAAX endopeptidase family protein [Alkaliphilus hydrothermalis]MBM7615917.1 membrane protease YdiL (CAAX protease family) [Alkaliphilus hydrothermalis]
MKERKLRVLDANLLYLICGILFITIGGYLQSKNLWSGLIITQYLIVLAPPVLYLLLRKINIKKTMRVNKISVKHGFLVALITILMYPTALFANTVFMFLLSLLGNLNVPQLPMPENIREYLIMIPIVSLTAGLCEEVLFRGFVMAGYERLGKKRAIIISAVLFGFFHMNIYNLMGPIVLGLVFGYLVVVTDSIFAGVIGHMVNNGFALTLGFGVNYIMQKVDLEKYAQADKPEVSTTVSLLVSAIFFAGLGIAFGLIGYQLIKIIKRDMDAKQDKLHDGQVENREEEIQNEQHKQTRTIEFLPLALMFVGIIFFAFLQVREIIHLG